MIELRDVKIRAGDFLLPQLSFSLPTATYTVLMGRTGMGKTSILETICGLRQPESGSVMIHGKDVTTWSPGEREIGYVPQDLALFPLVSVRNHLEFALQLRRSRRQEIDARVDELSRLLGIEHLLERSIKGLSGGEAQRVAIGRALSFRPRVLLLDEPLTALDQQTRTDIQSLLRTIKEATGVTTLHVTHNREEADFLADQLLFLDTDGVHVQETETVSDSGKTKVAK